METVLLVVMLPAFISALVLTLKALYHAFYIALNAGVNFSSFYGSLVWLLPVQSEEDIGRHRELLQPLLIGALLSWLVILVIVITIKVI